MSATAPGLFGAAYGVKSGRQARKGYKSWKKKSALKNIDLGENADIDKTNLKSVNGELRAAKENVDLHEAELPPLEEEAERLAAALTELDTFIGELGRRIGALSRVAGP
ncbi:hypothetical protein G3I76_11490, partial [Streptomyces sp. SID11233]|nr:hypothetical protein [Streptomyces sp. SID11233]